MRIFYGGIVPAVLYGVELVGMAATATRKIRTASLRAQCADIKGASLYVIWAVLGAERDPLCMMHIASLKRYHREWWASTSPNPPADVLTPKELVKAFDAVDHERATLSDGRSRTEGPIANVIRAAHSVGWTFTGPNTIDTGEGSFSFMDTSPRPSSEDSASTISGPWMSPPPSKSPRTPSARTSSVGTGYSTSRHCGPNAPGSYARGSTQRPGSSCASLLARSGLLLALQRYASTDPQAAPCVVAPPRRPTSTTT